MPFFVSKMHHYHQSSIDHHHDWSSGNLWKIFMWVIIIIIVVIIAFIIVMIIVIIMTTRQPLCWWKYHCLGKAWRRKPGVHLQREGGQIILSIWSRGRILSFRELLLFWSFLFATLGDPFGKPNYCYQHADFLLDKCDSSFSLNFIVGWLISTY